MKKLVLILVTFLATSCDIIIEPVLDVRNRISGTYYVQEYSETYRTTSSYQITVSRGYGSTVYLENFYGAGLSVTGQMYGNQIDIARQYKGSYEIQGVATFEGNSLRLTYSVRDNYYRSTDFCNSVANKW